MNEQAQIAAMAKLADFKPEPCGCGAAGCEIWRGPNGEAGLPRFLKDRNATHAVAMKLTREQQCDVSEMIHDWIENEEFLEAVPTAAQETEAILRAAGLWEE